MIASFSTSARRARFQQGSWWPPGTRTSSEARQRAAPKTRWERVQERRSRRGKLALHPHHLAPQRDPSQRHGPSPLEFGYYTTKTNTARYSKSEILRQLTSRSNSKTISGTTSNPTCRHCEKCPPDLLNVLNERLCGLSVIQRLAPPWGQQEEEDAEDEEGGENEEDEEDGENEEDAENAEDTEDTEDGENEQHAEEFEDTCFIDRGRALRCSRFCRWCAHKLLAGN